ncbi:hypothetical protein JKP88DRAFT_261323 [Tribonema minus]|uniref:Uncharacterized protein n=1 Tax=Tribonema minus TaxID=303371 RepID=A0A835YR63_9STRA|nr:hypothetical protein JKP88DRAFT_261323 [Tribonema minus]
MAMQDPGESAANTPFAEHWYLRAAAGAPPLPDALFQLARVYHEGLGPAGEDPVRALELYQRAAAEGSSAALFLLGHAHSVGDAELGLPRDARAALAYLQRSADIDEHPEALYHLALLHGAGDAEAGVERDEGRYVELVARAAAAGSANALFAEGDLWRRGLAGRERSEEKALHWFELAAGRERSEEKALRWFEFAAQQQHAEAAYCAAVMRYHGWGCDKDLRAAFELYQTAAEAGHVLAWREVASMHMLGEGVPRCEATARHIMQVMGKAIHKAEQEALAQNEGRSSS